MPARIPTTKVTAPDSPKRWHADLLTVFNERFDSNGCDIVLRPAGHYVSSDSVSVAQLRAAGLERNETILDYRVAATR